jgi:hypothetical protein
LAQHEALISIEVAGMNSTGHAHQIRQQASYMDDTVKDNYTPTTATIGASC